MNNIQKSYLQSQRLRAYRDMLMLDESETSDIQSLQHLWSELTQTAVILSNVKGTTVDEEAEICLTMLACLQVGIRNDEQTIKAVRRTLDVLPQLSVGTPLRLALLVFLYAETEDDDFRQEVEDHLFLLSDAPVDFIINHQVPDFDEPALLLQVWQTIKDSVPYGIPVD